MTLLRPFSKFALASVFPGFLVALIFAAVAMIPIRPNSMDAVGIAYVIFFPVLALIALGFSLCVVAIGEAWIKNRGVLAGLILLCLYSYPLWSMARQLF